MDASADMSDETLEKFIAEFKASGGSELANCQPFVINLCDVLGLPRPSASREENQFNDYVFERRVDFKHPDGTTTVGRIDCYKRGSFILEAKQSGKRGAKKIDPDQLALLPEDAAQRKPGHAKRGTRGWDQVMIAARRQAEDYARALPVEHGYPPFLIVVDVGHVIEIYADFSGQGKNYAHFPDRQSYRIAMDDLRDETVQTRLKAIWTDPQSLDPARKSAEVTRDIAARLARIARRLEKKHDPKDVAEFLMRCLFTMFAEDVGLLPEGGFRDLLDRMRDTPKNFVPALEHFWSVMNKGGYSPELNTTLKKFNGSLFKGGKALPLDGEDIHELFVAASKDWADVEPAIFGTLLERALEARERSKLGAHYTPRAYVERLVVPTIIEPLKDDWEDVKGRVRELNQAQKNSDALRLVKEFHHKLCTTRVLDPACGTGNFLYVSLELMKRLEGEVMEAMDDLGEDAPRFLMQGETVDPHQFFGLEINPRAVAIAELVLWIGYLKWQLKTAGVGAIAEPVLHAYGTIRQQDAILAYDREELLRDDQGRPLSRWDGVTMKLHPITGEEIPDPDAQMELYRYVNPRPAEWPEAEFVVGNPPFIGGKDMRAELGDGYAEACWKARPHMPGGADFVMHFWDEAAARLLRKDTKAKPNPLRRFGFITTNSITQTFSRRVIERHLGAKDPLSLVFAVPNHPWMKAADKAAVRIAMTVAEKGEREGALAEVASEKGLNTDTPIVALEKRMGKITAHLSIGPNLTLAGAILSNEALAHRGVQLFGAGFLLTPSAAANLRKHSPFAAEEYVFPYLNGRDIAQRPREKCVIDLYPLGIEDVKHRVPALYQHLLEHVKPERDQNNRRSYRERWWIFGEPRKELRESLHGEERYLATVETSRHRFFRFLPSSIRPDNKLICICVSRSEILAALSSRPHVAWAISGGAWMGVGNDPVYAKSHTFDPFPFPLCCVPEARAADPRLQAQADRLRELGERLETFRKERLAEHGFLTMTGMYNVLERLRELESGCDVEPLTDKEKAIHEAGLISVLKEIHDDIDRVVFEAYGWSDLADRLVGRPGATMPSPHKSPDQEAAEEELLTRLVALNRERAAEEKRGVVRWLRPDYQKPKLAKKLPQTRQEQIEAEMEIIELPEKPRWPSDGLQQIRLVRDVLARAPSPIQPEAVAAAFDGRNTAKRKERVSEVLETLVATGAARTGEVEGQTLFFVPR